MDSETIFQVRNVLYLYRSTRLNRGKVYLFLAQQVQETALDPVGCGNPSFSQVGSGDGLCAFRVS